MTNEQDNAEEHLALLFGGPAAGLAVPLGRDLIYVAVTEDTAGKRVPDIAKPPEGPDTPGIAVTLPDRQGPDVEVLHNGRGRKWECYRREGTYPIGYDATPADDLPAHDEPVYRWVCRRRT
jgi:hypothetical protein